MPLLLLLSQATFVFSAMLLLLFDLSLVMVDAITLCFRIFVSHPIVAAIPLHPIPI